VRHRHLLAWGYRYHGKESEGFDPEVGTWEDEPEHVDYEPLVDGDDATEALDEQESPAPSRSVTTLLDEFKHIPRAVAAKQLGKSEKEIQRIRNGRVHLSSTQWDEVVHLIRSYRRQQETKVEQGAVVRKAQRGGVPLDIMCRTLTEQGIYQGDPGDLDAFGQWLDDFTAKSKTSKKGGRAR
jgi:hypothetical protein